MIRQPLGVSLNKKRVSDNERELRAFISEWNNEFSLDYWWRQQHNISFNSSAHRESSILDILVEVEEFLLLQLSLKSRRLQSKNKMDYEISGNWINKAVINKKEEEDNFNNLDITKL